LEGGVLMARGNGLKIGIALGAESAVAVVMGKKGAPIARVPVSLEGEASGFDVDIARGLATLKRQVEESGMGPTDGASVHVALLPPLADARLIPFPPMRRSEVEAVLARDVARYFPGANRPRVVGVFRPRGRNNGGRNGGVGHQAVLAAASPQSLLEAISAALKKVDWRLSSFSAAHGAWLDSKAAGPGAPTAGVVAVLGDRAHVVKLAGPVPEAVRRVPADDPAAVVDALGEGSGTVLVLSGPQAYESLRRPLAEAGFSAARDPEGWPGTEEATAGRAASSALPLVPPTLASERERRSARTTLRMVLGALALVLVSLAFQYWGAHRELQAVQERRTAIRSDVAPLIEARDSLLVLEGQVEALTSLSSSSPVWTRALVDLSALLPSDTYLTGFFASGDTVEVEAAGTRAGEAIQALRSGGLFEELRLQGLVERELEDGETVEERFRLWARLPQGGGERGDS